MEILRPDADKIQARAVDAFAAGDNKKGIRLIKRVDRIRARQAERAAKAASEALSNVDGEE